MNKLHKIAFYQDGDMYLGYLEEFPDYWTQGETVEELKENLKDIYDDVSGGFFPRISQNSEIMESKVDSEAFKTMLASEEVLARDWNTPEEDAAWAHL